jgi:hypothetical protein
MRAGRGDFERSLGGLLAAHLAEVHVVTSGLASLRLRSAVVRPAAGGVQFVAHADAPNCNRCLRKRIIRLPNPWPPDTIDALALIAVTSAGIAPYTYRFILAWIEDRKAKRIKIKQGEPEVEIQGGVSEKEMARAFSQFRRLTRGRKDEKPKIILPRGADRSFSLDLISGKDDEEQGRKK